MTHIEFKEGDIVSIEDAGQVYTTYGQKARELKLDNWTKGMHPDQQAKYIVIRGNSGYEEHKNYVAVENMRSGSQFILNYWGLKHV